ncbi:MAG: hypothetical protein M8364_18455 [Methylobacter sp.]|uniref:hypothetical protein n=1 Tax=Methylobacter sp. TaxID=2051955 RepID=UPI00258277BA|nr:hypothetical protein [Methylobacter sp.]MCL7422876.1 hypothetical protein [Methylobacter sp.]
MGLVMRSFSIKWFRYSCLLFMFAFSGSAFAVTVEEAYAQCLVKMSEDTYGLPMECRKDDPYDNNINLMRQNLQGAWGLLAMFPYHSDCVAPEVWDGESCALPPEDCVAGTQKTLTEFQPTGGTVFYIGGGGPVLSDSGCRYECSSSGSDGSFYYDDTGTYRDYSCTSTGDEASESDTPSATVPASAKSSDGTTNADGQSCSTVGGTTVCVGGNLGENCMTVNGVKTCQSEAAADEAVIDDTPVSKSDSKNCVKSTDGEIICVADQSESEFCGTVNGVKTCYSRSGAKETTTTTEETLGDGTVVVTKETGSNVRNNVNDGRIIETTAPDGSVTTVREGGDQGALQDIAKAAGKAECDKPGMAGTVACMDADEFKGEAGTPGPSGEGAESGRWYTATDKTFQSVLESSMSQLQNQPIMQFGNDLFAVTIPAGSCPSWTIDGSAAGIAPITVSPLCSEMMENFWPMISGVVQVLAVFMAFYIAMRGL